jgi:hypothetical protein
MALVGTSRALAAALLAVLTVSVGCKAPGPAGTLFSPASQPAPSADTSASPMATIADTLSPLTGRAPGLQQQTIIILHVSFDILRARAPKGFFSESGRIWNHLDEEAVPAETATMLQRNGLRIGRGRVDSWPPIKALLDEQKKLQTSRTSLSFTTGEPLVLQLAPSVRDQTLFLIRQDGSMGGVTCPVSSNYLRVEYEIPLNDPSGVIVQVLPEIRQRQVLSSPDASETGRLEETMREPTRVLRELGFRMELPADSFVAYGPSAAANGGHLAGSLLLCEEIDGTRYESMYFVTPRVFRTEHHSGEAKATVLPGAR